MPVSVYPAGPTPAGSNLIGTVQLGDETTPTNRATVDAGGYQFATVNNSIQEQTGTITAAAQTVNNTIGGAKGLSNISIRGTYAAGLQLIFEVSDDGTNYWQVAAIRNDNNASEDVPILIANESRMWRVSTTGYQNVRVRALAWGSPSGTANVRIVSNTLSGEPVNTGTAGMIPASLNVTVTAAAAAGATCTLPAVAAQFHYITYLEVVMYCTAARTGGATPVIVTTTNLPGSPAYTFESAQAVGTAIRRDMTPNSPLKSSVLNTNTTIVGPATASVIWRINCSYYTGVY